MKEKVYARVYAICFQGYRQKKSHEFKASTRRKPFHNEKEKEDYVDSLLPSG
jgi:hypothetical protein